MSLSKSPSETDGESTETSTHERLLSALDEKGELMVRTASGEELELHKHNVEREDAPWIKIDGDDQVNWFNTQAVERYWIHEEL